MRYLAVMIRIAFYLLPLLVLLVSCKDDPYADMTDGSLALEQNSGLDLATAFDAEQTTAVLQTREADRYLSLKTYDPSRQMGILIQLSLPLTGDIAGAYTVSGDNTLLYIRESPMMEVYNSATCRPARGGQVVITDYDAANQTLSGTFEGVMCTGAYQSNAAEIEVSGGRFKSVEAMVL